MPEAIVMFHKLYVRSQRIRAANEHIDAQVWFDIILPAQKLRHQNLYAQVSLKPGESFDVPHSLVVEIQPEYKGPMNAAEFTEIVDRYYMDRIGPNARGINIGKEFTSSDTGVYDCTFPAERTATFSY